MGNFSVLKLFLPGEIERARRTRTLLEIWRSLPLEPNETEQARMSRACWMTIQQLGLPRFKDLMAWTRRGVEAPFPTKEHTKKYLLLKAEEYRDSLHPEIVAGLGTLSYLLEEEKSQTGRDYQAELDAFALQLKQAAGN